MRNASKLIDNRYKDLSVTDVSPGIPTLDTNLKGTIASSILSTLQAILAATGGGSKTTVALARNVYSSTNVTTAAYVQIVASLSDDVSQIYIFDSSGQTLVLATGAAASEVNKYYIIPGGNGLINLTIPAGTRVSLKAISANATVGEFSATFLK